MSAPRCVNPSTWLSTYIVIINSYSLLDSLFHIPHNISDLNLPDNRNRSTKLLMYHKAKYSHHGSTAIVQLNGTFGELSLLIKVVPAKFNGTVAEVAHKLASLSTVGRVLHYNKLKEINKGNQLNEALLGGGIRARDGLPAIG